MKMSVKIDGVNPLMQGTRSNAGPYHLRVHSCILGVCGLLVIFTGLLNWNKLQSSVGSLSNERSIQHHQLHDLYTQYDKETTSTEDSEARPDGSLSEQEEQPGGQLEDAFSALSMGDVAFKERGALENLLRNRFKSGILLSTLRSINQTNTLRTLAVAYSITAAENRKFFIVHADGSLFSRMLAVASAMACARMMNRVLIVVWEQDQSCGVRFQDMFASDILYASEFHPGIFPRNYDTGFRKINFIDPRSMGIELRHETGSDAKHIYVKANGVIKYERFMNMKPDELHGHLSRELHRLQPIESIRNELRDITACLPVDISQMVGIHVRMNQNVSQSLPPDDSSVYTNAKAWFQSYRNHLRAARASCGFQYVRENPLIRWVRLRKTETSVNFFVASDSVTIYQNIRAEMKPRNIVYTAHEEEQRNCHSANAPSIECERAAYIQMYLMSKTGLLLVSLNTAFSDVAVLMSHSPAGSICNPKPPQFEQSPGMLHMNSFFNKSQWISPEAGWSDDRVVDAHKTFPQVIFAPTKRERLAIRSGSCVSNMESQISKGDAVARQTGQPVQQTQTCKDPAAPRANFVSIIVATMNREETLLGAMETWLMVRGVNEVVVVDWSSIEPVEPALRRLNDDRIKVVRVEGEPSWVLSRAYNLAIETASGDRILKVDSETLLQPDFLAAHPLRRRQFYRGMWWKATNENQVHLNGLCYIWKDDFVKVRGYDERITQYGMDDTDLYDRLENIGVDSIPVDLDRAGHMEHDDTLRTTNQEVRLTWISQFRNQMILDRQSLQMQALVLPWHQSHDWETVWGCESPETTELGACTCKAISQAPRFEDILPHATWDQVTFQAYKLSLRKYSNDTIEYETLEQFRDIRPMEILSMLYKKFHEDGSPILALKPIGTPCNRLLAVLAAMSLAKQYGYQLLVIWEGLHGEKHLDPIDHVVAVKQWEQDQQRLHVVDRYVEGMLPSSIFHSYDLAQRQKTSSFPFKLMNRKADAMAHIVHAKPDQSLFITSKGFFGISQTGTKKIPSLWLRESPTEAATRKQACHLLRNHWRYAQWGYSEQCHSEAALSCELDGV